MKVLGTAIALESGKKVVEHVAKSAKEALAEPGARAAITAAAKKYGLPVLRVAGIYGALLGIGVWAASRIPKEHEKEARAWADLQLGLTARKLPNLTGDQAGTLWQQYYRYALKQGTTNSYLGK